MWKRGGAGHTSRGFQGRRRRLQSPRPTQARLAGCKPLGSGKWDIWPLIAYIPQHRLLVPTGPPRGRLPTSAFLTQISTPLCVLRYQVWGPQKALGPTHTTVPTPASVTRWQQRGREGGAVNSHGGLPAPAPFSRDPTLSQPACAPPPDPQVLPRKHVTASGAWEELHSHLQSCYAAFLRGPDQPGTQVQCSQEREGGKVL